MTVQLAPTPVFKAFDANGAPLFGGQLSSYQAGTLIRQATWVDSTQTTQNTNPVILNSRGEANIWLDPTLTYKFLLQDSSGNQIWVVDNVVGGYLTYALLSALLTQAYLGAIIFPQSAAEIAASVTPSNYGYPVGDIRRYGAKLDGVTDDTAAFQNWVKIGGKLTFPVVATGLISASLTLVSNSTLDFVEGATIKNATNNINMLQATNASNIIVRGAFLLSTAATSSTQIGGIALTSCTNCTIEDCTFNGMPFNGIWGTACNYCTIRNNYFSTASGAQTSSCGDINWVSSPTSTTSYNVIDGNYCYGGGEFGIAVWDPYSGVLPIHNIITNNRIGAQSGYGILIYMPDSGASYNQVIGNHVQDITGIIASNTSSGAGIYITGAGCGGTVVANNTVFNCCISTANASLAPAGIGISGGGPTAGTVPITVSGNVVTGMTQYNGILVTGIQGVILSGNSVRMPATQTTLGHAIAVVNSNDISVSNNNIVLLSSTQNQCGVFLEATGAPYSDVVISGNNIWGGHYAQIRFVGALNTYSHVTVIGNVCNGNGDTTCIPLRLESGAANEVQVLGNTFPSTSATAISQIACTGVQYSGNFVTGTGAVLSTSGSCTGSFYGRTNFGTGTGAGISNGATGFIVEQLGTASPSAGTWAVGDTVRNSAPSAGGVYEWICTTLGTGGGTAVFKTISNT